MFVSLALIACGSETPEPETLHTLTVRPHLTVDGVGELGAVAGARVIVDQVLFHAPLVVLASDVSVQSLVAADESPLLFRYDAHAEADEGVDPERVWSVRDTAGQLVVRFAPLESEMGAGLDDLRGHTAAVRGFLLLNTASDTTRGCDEAEGTSTTGLSSCDPDASADAASEGDPDGNPSEGDPDGNPSHTKQDAGEGDPDGNPSHDPESDGEPTLRRLMHVGSDILRGPKARADDRQSTVKVPFLLVLNRAFSLQVPMAELLASGADGSEARSLQLHVHLDELFSQEMLALLKQSAASHRLGTIVATLPDAAITLDSEPVAPKVRASVTTGGVRIAPGR